MGDYPLAGAYDEAVRCRATGVGLVPIGVIRRLTSVEWSRVRVMGQAEARRLVFIRDAEPLVTIDLTREGADYGH